MGGHFEDPRLRDGTAPSLYQYVFNIGLSASQFFSTLLGGDPDESICSRAGRAAQGGNLLCIVLLVPILNAIMGKDHCRYSIEPDEGDKEIWSW